MSNVAIINGVNRYQNVYQALLLIKEEIKPKIENKKQIVIKPNLCVSDNPLAVTHVDSVKALLDFLIQELNVSQNITIAEAPFSKEGIEQCFINYKYKEKLINYPVKLVDLNQDKTQEFEIFYKKNKSIKLNLAKTILDSDFLISICPAKTHDAVITTLSIKNVAVGSIIVSAIPLVGHTRFMIHGSAYKINKIISSVAKYVRPDLAIIDGVVGMEGNGPTSHDAVNFGLVFASLDLVAADSICSYLMGFDPQSIGYLYYCDQMGLGTNNLSKIQVLGLKDYKKYKRTFKPHAGYLEQLQWRQEPKIKTFINLLQVGIRTLIRKAVKVLFERN